MNRFQHWLSAGMLATLLLAQTLVLPVAGVRPQVAPAGGGDAPAAAASMAEAPAPVQPKGKLIFIDPGHGGKDAGAAHQGPNGEADVVEDETNLAIALKLADMLRAEGYDVQLSRTDDTFVDLTARVDQANQAGADLFISVHHNGSENAGQKGTEVWYCGDRPFAQDNERLATLVQQAMVHNLRQAGYETVDRGIKDDARMGHFAVIGPRGAHSTQMPGIIGEALFMTNDGDAAQLKRPEIRDALARAYFDGVQAYFAGAR